MHKPITSIAIVGGGSAGWITAGTLAAKIKKECADTVRVTLIESPNTPIIGVGEGTWPTMRNTLKKMGIRETDFINECNATFKQGAKFIGWTTGEESDAYYHPLVLPIDFNKINLAPHWLNNKTAPPFAEAVCMQAELCEQGRAPKDISTPEYSAIANYAYHLDAGAFSQFLKKHCMTSLNVEYLEADVTQVNTCTQTGDILSLSANQKTPQGATLSTEIEADLFIDCTGFQSLLLGKHYQVPFKSCKDTLFIDSALAVHLPYENACSPIASHTLSTAQTNGWIWDIGLQNRRGIGYVYSTAHSSESEAEQVLHAYLAPHIERINTVNGQPISIADLTIRNIPIEPGHRTQFWVNNCVAIGLSAGFLEPLEASALVLIEISAAMIAEQLPATRAAMDIVAKRYNKTNLYRWQQIIDFLKLHYVLSQRTDSGFWRENRAPSSIPSSLSDLLQLWQHQPPWHHDFDHAVEVFPAASYQYLLYGMGFKTKQSHIGMSRSNIELAKSLFDENKHITQKLAHALPNNRELINKIKAFGLQVL